MLLIAVGAIVQLTSGSAPRPQPSDREFCFGEWCIRPVSATWSPTLVRVQVRVRSDAKAVAQRPDHPQAWLVDADTRRTGGQQPSLERSIGPGESFVTSLSFATASPNGCFGLVVAEGGWPPFLGLGYAASPFTERVQWRICNLHTAVGKGPIGIIAGAL